MKIKSAFPSMRGLAIVEMAIVVPVFLVMLFGILEFGIVLYDKALITNASLQLAQSGSQMTSTSQALPPSQIESNAVISAVTARSAISNILGTGLVSFGAAQAAATAKIGGWDGLGYPLTVTVNYSYKSLVLSALMNLFGGSGLANPIPMSTSTSMYLN